MRVSLYVGWLIRKYIWYLLCFRLVSLDDLFKKEQLECINWRIKHTHNKKHLKLTQNDWINEISQISKKASYFLKKCHDCEIMNQDGPQL